MNDDLIQGDLFGGPIRADSNQLETEEEVAVTKSGFNIFTITEAIAKRDKKTAWLLFEKALASGLTPEEIFWKVVWQVKALLVAKNTANAMEAEMKEWPYSKAKANLKNYKEGELEDMSRTLVVGYHEARRGGVEIESLLAKFILNL